MLLELRVKGRIDGLLQGLRHTITDDAVKGGSIVSPNLACLDVGTTLYIRFYKKLNMRQSKFKEYLRALTPQTRESSQRTGLGSSVPNCFHTCSGHLQAGAKWKYKLVHQDKLIKRENQLNTFKLNRQNTVGMVNGRGETHVRWIQWVIRGKV